MGRKKSKLWEYAEDLKNSRFRCNFCEKEFGGGASRITTHLAGEKGHDIAICDKVLPGVQAHAFNEIHGPNKKPKSTAPSSNNVEENGTISLQSLPEDAHISSALTNVNVLPTTTLAGQTTDIRNMEEGPSMMTFDPIMTGKDMGRKKKEFWEYTEKLDGNRFKCKFCNREFAGGASRITAHLAGEKGHDIAICSQVPPDVKDRALEEIPRGNKRHKIAPSSNNVEEIRNLQSVPAGDAHILSALTDGFFWSWGHGDVLSTRALAGPTTAIRNMEEGPSMVTSDPIIALTNGHHNSHLSNGDVLPTTAAGQTSAIRNMEENPSMVIADADIPFQTASCSHVGEQVTHHRSRSSNGDILPTTTLAGETTTRRNMGKIWACLMNDRVEKIGVYGMAGVGKTTIMKHINNRLLKESDKFENVIWVSLSNASNVIKLQNEIAYKLDLDLSKFEDEITRSAKLYAALENRKRYVLILDNMWEAVMLEDIGIPEPTIENGCKLVLTTRCLDVCRKMDFEKIKVELLSKSEAWDMFLNIVGRDVSSTQSLKEIMKKVVEKCACLPLAIITVARSLKGEVNDYVWRTALEELRESHPNNKWSTVLEKLKLSYTRLKDEKCQNCFLYCVLYPKDYKIEKDDLIKNLIDEGIIQGMKSRQAEFDKGYSMLNDLENACLLERVGDKYVQMHDLVRDMAIQIAQARHGFMVEAGKRLEDLPDKEKWKEDLVRVSLMYNGLTKIPSNALRGCPKLSTLMLNNNNYLETIPDDFFVQMPGLKVLNLSYTNIEYLPDSIFNLKNLTALVLFRCEKLKHVNSLEKLTALRRLELVHTGIKEIPQGLEMLVNLRHLNLCLQTLKIFPSGILLKFSQLRHLEFSPRANLYYAILWNRRPSELPRNWYSKIPWNLNLEAEEVESLKKLETFKCQFNDIHAFNTCVKSLEKVRPTNYVLILGSEARYGCEEGKQVILKDCRIITEKDALLLPADVQFLKLCDIGDLRSLCDLPSSIPLLESIEVLNLTNLENLSLLVASSPPPSGTFSRLKEFTICFCHGIKKLFMPWLLQYLHNLEKIHIEYCFNLEEIIEELSDEEEDDDEGMDTTIFSLPKLWVLELSILKILHICPKLKRVASSPVPPGTFSQLQIFNMFHCHYIKVVFTPGLLLHLQNLEEIIVFDCVGLLEIIGASSDDEVEEEDDERNKEEAIDITLPKLRVLKLEYLPSLESICGSSQLMVCDSIQEIQILDCPYLKRLPLSLPLVNEQLCPPPSLYKIEAEEEWWESLEWDDPNSKAVLQSFVEYDSNEETSDGDS